MREMMEHCGLELSNEVIGAYAGKLNPPSYYNPNFSGDELTAIAEETADCETKFGYRPRDANKT